MMRILFLVAVTFFSLNTHAQTIVSDSAETGPQAKLSTFYRLANGTKTVTEYSDWHLAISIRPSSFPDAPLGGTSIRFNEPVGVNIYYVPNANAASFNTVDTTGYKHWTKLHDSDTALDEGALNSNRDRGAIFDFGWGVYNSSTHNVVGDSLYLIELPTGGLKKFLVVNLHRDTAFNIQYSNIDNSEMQTLHISKKEYVGKEFVYLNLVTNLVMDKEPLANAWDLQFLKYDATNIILGKSIPAVGVWINKGIEVAKRQNHAVNDNDYSNLTFSSQLNAIGWDWKQLKNTISLESGKNSLETFDFYVVDDSLSYFIKTLAGEYYKLVFTGYNSGSGLITFTTEHLSLTGIETPAEEAPKTLLYPNPANNELNVLVNTLPATLRVFDVSGRMVAEQTAGDKLVQVNTANMANGLYILQVNSNGKTSNSKFTVSQ